MRLEVRCCCQPQKLLGTVEVRDDHGDVVVFDIPGPHSGPRELSAVASMNVVQLPVAIINILDGYGRQAYRAVKAEGVSIETLRTIPSFIEAAP